jgi:uncharacterized membrane protein YdjX (TVP38/TMEM64 family)
MPDSYVLSKNLLRISKFLKWLFKPTIRYSNIAIFIISIILSYFILTSEILKYAISKMGNFGYVGAFIGGLFYPISFTIAPSVSLLYLLGKSLNPFLIALIGGTGGTISTFIVFHVVKKSFENIELFSWLRVKIFLLTARSRFLRKIKESKFAQYIIPVIAGLIIASPLPDELAAAIMGAVKYETKKFLLFSFLLNFLGIFLVATVGKVI